MRVHLPFPASVEGVNDGGEPFRVDTVLDDISVGGVYLRLTERVSPEAVLMIKARFSVVTNRGLVVGMMGKVLRVEPKPGGVLGVAVAVEQKRIL